jgi:ABC-type multidrug transport system fused ATPase/permease subunit
MHLLPMRPAFAPPTAPALARHRASTFVRNVPAGGAARRVRTGRPRARRARGPAAAAVVMVATVGGGGGGGGDDGELDLESPEERRRRDVGRLLRLFARLGSPYLRRTRTAKIDTGLVLASTLANNGISVLISFISRDFWSALNTKSRALFFRQALLFFGVLCVCVPVITFGQYVRDMAALRWRSWMTETVMKEYLSNRAFYTIDQQATLDNPDQRLSADISAFTSESLSFILTVVTSLIDIVSFSAILWSIEPSLFIVLLAYAGTGTLATAYVGKRFVALMRRQLVREADLRYSLVRLRENAESIAFFNGEDRENRDLSRRLGQAVTNAKSLIGWKRNLGFLQSVRRPGAGVQLASSAFSLWLTTDAGCLLSCPPIDVQLLGAGPARLRGGTAILSWRRGARHGDAEL